MDHFEVNLFPMKIQLEREVRAKAFSYMFPGSDDDKPGTPKNKSPLMVRTMQPVDDDDEENNSYEYSKSFGCH